MKNLLSFAGMLVGVLFSFTATGQNITIPDANFKYALVNGTCVDTDGINGPESDADTNNDGQISVNEAEAVITLFIYNSSIFSLEGIQHFTNLEILYCWGNQLTSLDVSGLANLHLLQCQYNQLTSLDVSGLINLEILYCFDNQLTTLDVSGLTNLQEFSCDINQLMSLDVSASTNLQTFSCSENQITSLDVSALTNLQEFSCALNQLTSLYIKNGISEINGFGDIFYFYGNPNLTYICADENQLADIQIKVIEYGYTNCSVNSYCSYGNPEGGLYLLQGQNKWDTNNNGCDINDPIFPNLKYSITNGTNTGVLISNETGNYTIPLQEGSHTITPQLENPSYFTVSPSSVTLNLPQDTLNLVQNFCITPNGEHHDVEVTIIPTIPARPGFDASYQIVYKNKGNQVESDSINFTYQDDRMDFISASIAPDAQYTNVLQWNYSNLQPFETRTITVVMNINSPMETSAVNVGDVLSFNAVIYPYSMDEMQSDNSFNLRQIVVGSYDPNDKTCLEGEQISPEKVGDYLHYLIRFENTGTYAAENIVVKDMIDTSKFDIRTLQLTETSHSCWVRVIGANRAEFIFENINLPFTEPDKHGYVAFKIKTKPNLVLGDAVTNQADIFFDYNFPITTNLTTTTVAITPVLATLSSNNTLNCHTTTATLTASGGWLYDFGNGFSPSPTMTVQAAGTYTVTVQDMNGYTGTSTIVVVADFTSPTATINAVSAYPCTQLTATGGTNYNWNTGNTNASFTANEGTYTVTVTGANGCTATQSNAIVPNEILISQTGGSLIAPSQGVSYQWFLDGTPIATATAAIYTPTQSGNYTVEIGNAEGCVVLSTPFAYLYVSTEEELSSIELKISPNPTNGTFTLQPATLFNAQQMVVIQNAIGQTVYITSVPSQVTSHNIDISFLSAGLYFVVVQDTKTAASKSFKLMLQK